MIFLLVMAYSILSSREEKKHADCLSVFLIINSIFNIYNNNKCVLLGHEELWESPDPPAVLFSSWRGSHADLPDPVWMSRSPGLQKLHLSHHPSSHGHPQTGRQPQQSPRYAHVPLPSNTISCWVTQFIRVQDQRGFWNESYSGFSDNWWSLMDCEVFTRLVEMYKSIVVFLLTGGKALLMPVFLESYTSAALRLLEKLHKVPWKTTKQFNK